MGWSIVEVRPNVHMVNMPYPDKDDQWCLFLSDLHWDNPKCRRDLLARHLDEAVEHDAPIFLIGDTFCAMQGKYDKRSSKIDLRPEHAEGNYLDSLVETAADWFEPYKEHIALIGYGNHETAIQNRHETDLVDRLCSRLRSKGGITRAGGYGGWLRFKFTRHKTKRGSITTYYHHGFGGGGPITKGSIDFSRYMMHARADIYIAGHVHYRMHFPDVQACLTEKGMVMQKQVDWVRCGTYKDEYVDGALGFHIEKGRGPRPMGGYWCRFHKRRAEGQAQDTIPTRQFIPTED